MNPRVTIACVLIVGSFSLPVPVVGSPVTGAFEGTVTKSSEILPVFLSGRGRLRPYQADGV